MATQYKTSDFLADRHPYFPEDHEAIFTKDVNPHEVGTLSYALRFARS